VEQREPNLAGAEDLCEELIVRVTLDRFAVDVVKAVNHGGPMRLATTTCC
jgi:hypothetical protein